MKSHILSIIHYESAEFLHLSDRLQTFNQHFEQIKFLQQATSSQLQKQFSKQESTFQYLAEELEGLRRLEQEREAVERRVEARKAVAGIKDRLEEALLEGKERRTLSTKDPEDESANDIL